MPTRSRFRPVTVFRAGMIFLIFASLVPMLPRFGAVLSDAWLGALEGFLVGLVIACLVVSQRLKRRA